jgi:hypothetical protein
MSFSRNYRQYSYSENNIKDIVFSKKKENGDYDYSVAPSESSIRLSLNNVDNQSISNQSINNLDNQSINNQDTSEVSEENEIQKKEYNIGHYLFKRFLIFTALVRLILWSQVTCLCLVTDPMEQ